MHHTARTAVSNTSWLLVTRRLVNGDITPRMAHSRAVWPLRLLFDVHGCWRLRLWGSKPDDGHDNGSESGDDGSNDGGRLPLVFRRRVLLWRILSGCGLYMLGHLAGPSSHMKGFCMMGI